MVQTKSNPLQNFIQNSISWPKCFLPSQKKKIFPSSHIIAEIFIPLQMFRVKWHCDRTLYLHGEQFLQKIMHVSKLTFVLFLPFIFLHINWWRWRRWWCYGTKGLLKQFVDWIEICKKPYLEKIITQAIKMNSITDHSDNLYCLDIVGIHPDHYLLHSP